MDSLTLLSKHHKGLCHNNCSFCRLQDWRSLVDRQLAEPGFENYEARLYSKLGYNIGYALAWKIYQLDSRSVNLGQLTTNLFPDRPNPERLDMAKKRFTKKRLTTKKAKPKFELPTEKSVVSHELNDYSFYLHGVPKIGKTTLATAEGDVLVLSFDPPRPGLEILQKHMPDWSTLLQAVDALVGMAESGDFIYDRVVVDRIDLAYNKCSDYICSQRGIDHPSDEGYAKAWHALRDAFTEVVIKLMALPCGSWFVCHSRWKEEKNRRTGVTTEKLVPDLGNRAEEILVGLCDGGFAYDYSDDERVIIVQGDQQVSAGINLDDNFRTTDGRRVVEVPAGKSAKEAWTNFNAAFNNEQEFVDLRERDEQAEKGGSVTKKKTRRKKTTKKKTR